MINRPRTASLFLYTILYASLLSQAVTATDKVKGADVRPAMKATPVEQIKLLPGFQAELIYSVPRQQQGSWVSMTVDPKGRLITSDQDGDLYRITPLAIGAKDAKTKVEHLQVDMGMAHGLLYAFDSLYAMVNGGKQRKSGLYRLRDTDGDDQFDQVKLLREIPGRGEHGPHAIVLGPDGKSLYVSAGNHTDLPGVEKSRVPRNWQEDQLLPRMVDARGHAATRRAPGGWICKVDPDGKEFELISIGYRNEYDIAFNPEGELFTYDADMEWDVGTPWYRPTRVLHVTGGSEFGWRTGTGKWPTYYPDSLPEVVNIGPGSPTGVVFGTGAKFPAKYQRALFISDWSYGMLYAVHLTPQGATFTGELERFASAAPLPLTDLVINSIDGAFYFTIGGRQAQSGLYRITYVGDESTTAVKSQATAGAKLRKKRRELEALHVAGAADAVKKAWPALNHADRHIRYAARVAIEHQPVDQWQHRALSEKRPWAAITAALALARNGDKSLLQKIIVALGRLDFQSLRQEERLGLLRAYGLTFSRMGMPGPRLKKQLVELFDAQYPATDRHTNRELCQLLVYLQSPSVASKTLPLLAEAATQEEQIQYALSLRNLSSGWTLAQRREYFQWFNQAGAHRGGASFGGFLNNIRNEAIAKLDAKEKQALKEVLTVKPQSIAPDATFKARPFVKKWTVAEVLADVNDSSQPRNFQHGRKLFSEGACFKCHRFAGEGGVVGPDLTSLGGRFNVQNILESIIDPSKVISDQYQASVFILSNGKTVTGRVVNFGRGQFRVMTNMLDPGNLAGVPRDQVDEMFASPVSMMPTGMFDTFTVEEIADMVAYLRSAGNPDHELFK